MVSATSSSPFKAPPPTHSELKLRSILRSNEIVFKYGQTIWYTSCDKYTPDLIIGRLIVEVDGKIHDREYKKTPDRIRERALRNMGYEVIRVRNDEIQKTPNIVADRIIQKNFEVAGKDNQQSRITKLKMPQHYDPVPKEIDFMLQVWASQFSKGLDDDKWIAEHFMKVLSQFHPELTTNQCAMERLILLLLGLKLHKLYDEILDFEHSSNLLKKGIAILKELFRDRGEMAIIHFKVNG